MPITQYKIALSASGSASLPRGISYPLYAALLAEIPRDYGDALHQTGFTPVAQHLRGNCWTVSLLNRRAAEMLGPVLERKTEYRLWGDRVILSAQSRCTAQVEDAEAFLYEDAPSRGTLVLRSPTAFRSGDAYQLLPTQRLVLQSLLNRWNGCFPEFSIEQEEGGLEMLADRLRITSVRLESSGFRIKGQTIPGVTGELGFKIDGEDFPALLCGALLRLGCLSGVGIKTALGMGGMEIKTEKQKK